MFGLMRASAVWRTAAGSRTLEVDPDRAAHPSHIHRTRECDGTVENAKCREGKVAFYVGFRGFALVDGTAKDRARNPKVAGSNPAPATKEPPGQTAWGFVVGVGAVGRVKRLSNGVGA